MLFNLKSIYVYFVIFLKYDNPCSNFAFFYLQIHVNRSQHNTKFLGNLFFNIKSFKNWWCRVYKSLEHVQHWKMTLHNTDVFLRLRKPQQRKYATAISVLLAVLKMCMCVFMMKMEKISWNSVKYISISVGLVSAASNTYDVTF